MVVGAGIGFAVFGSYTLQTLGLQTIPSSTSAFLTALYVPLVPLLQWAALRARPGLSSLAGTGCALAGLLLLTGGGLTGLGLGRGEVATVAGAVATAAEIVLISRFAGTVDARRVTVVQLAATAVLALALRPATGEALPGPSPTLLLTAGGLGLATALIQLTVNWAQRCVPATRATVIYTGEPLWAALFGRLAGERLPASALAGGALIVLGVVVSEVPPPRRPHGGRVRAVPGRWGRARVPAARTAPAPVPAQVASAVPPAAPAEVAVPEPR